MPFSWRLISLDDFGNGRVYDFDNWSYWLPSACSCLAQDHGRREAQPLRLADAAGAVATGTCVHGALQVGICNLALGELALVFLGPRLGFSQ